MPSHPTPPHKPFPLPASLPPLTQMIVSGLITYPGVNSTLQTWQPRDPVIYAILVATLTTVLSYQATSLVFDLFLGFKRRGEARLTDVGTLLLTEEASIPALCASLWDNGNIARWKFHGFRESCPHQQPHLHNKRRMRLPVFVKFLALLIVAPLINLVTIVLNMESNRDVTFEEANFGGIALGVNDNLTGVLTAKQSDTCSSYEFRYARLETPLTEFHTCKSDVFVDERRRDDEAGPVGTFKLTRSQGGNGIPVEAIVAEFRYGRLISRLVFHADVYVSTQGKAYRLRSVLTLEQGKRLFKAGIEQQLKECAGEELGSIEEKILTPEVADVQHQQWEVSQEVRCVGYAEWQSKAVMVTMTGPLTLVNHDNFEVMQLRSAPQFGETQVVLFESGVAFPLLRRRRTIASFLTLIITVVCAGVLRGLTKLFTNNDIYIGIELVLKDKFGINSCDSMLQTTRRVQYKGSTELRLDPDTIMRQEMAEWTESRENYREEVLEKN